MSVTPSAGAPIRILIADDHRLLREGLRRLLEAEPGLVVVGEAEDGEVALELARALKPDILLLDLAMPRLAGLEALRELAGAGLDTRTILLTAAAEKPDIVKALQLGARGIVLKQSATEVLFRSIRSVMAGEYWVGRECVSDLVQTLRALDAPPSRPAARKTFGLTPRELEITSTVVAGYTNKDIAQKFSISEDTVKHHLSNIFDKAGVSSRLELALFAVNHRILDEG
ncbi:MAG TPA: response regulator transcription factor [Vicinamibacteria bacterium]